MACINSETIESFQTILPLTSFNYEHMQQQLGNVQ
ncbi:hypothetical protein FOQG_01089 [Fusarium oxysporum f. sp. raphani 54005]|uniref:Uncharacterized protein n=3 Tax=Fusarium oxysporum TaxID=5507 RepID=X0CV82_FUSOX|nr:hypothetical protein FOVG_08928 [Fusarium oxysporum f. sp. pisi HDV247]EXK98076.1 hypothetical protein FOQG_01089 [Fusarium oxysporum f. sp. raphani 54005]EXL84059.1 hypothetical protein FOPG_03612 [Fusarium oxysporum f. sp. conglutinans race 2 54008]